jgi:hypothetical protein
MTAAAG